jgi:hypothetical protein
LSDRQPLSILFLPPRELRHHSIIRTSVAATAETKKPSVRKRVAVRCLILHREKLLHGI